VVGVDLLRARRVRIGCVREPHGLDPREDLVEALVIDQEGVVLHLYLFDRRLGKLDRYSVVELHLRKLTPTRGVG
jgi:hypothetical protein